jgi:hypothetical protein
MFCVDPRFHVDPAEAGHKRRQEEQYAIWLKQQIEERRQAKEAERQARDRDAWLATIVPRSSEPLLRNSRPMPAVPHRRSRAGA